MARPLKEKMPPIKRLFRIFLMFLGNFQDF